MADSFAAVLHEIAERPNPPRQLRGYPRVVKRTQAGDKLIKRAHHRQTEYENPPKIQLVQQDAA
jgi:hypothetical protein